MRIYLSTVVKLIGVAWMFGGLTERVFQFDWIPFLGAAVIILGLLMEEHAHET